jgi:hypothetical protein
MPDTSTEFNLNPPDEQIDLRGLVRLGLWGAAAVGSLLLAVMAMQSENGSRRMTATLNQSSATAQVAARKQDAENDSRRLIESVRTLSSDRDRLLARVTVLERNLEDVTGSVGRIGAHNVAGQPSPLPQAHLSVGPSVLTSISAPPTIAAFPSARVATAHSTARGTPPPPESVGTVTDFGIDIGGGPNIESLRDLWTTAKGTHGAMLDGLRPVISVRDGKHGTAELRLVVGPLSNAAAAAKICASLATNGWTCRPAVFDGQRLALR